MTQVALVSQTLRAAHCRAFVIAEGGEWLVVTADPGAFDEIDLGPSARVISVTPPPQLLPSARLAEGRWFRSVLRWARSGSRFGRWLERTVKRILWRLRYLDRLVFLRRRAKPRPIDPRTIRTSTMFARLAEAHASTPLDRIVVFDLFDLPVALAFSEDYGVKVVVR